MCMYMYTYPYGRNQQTYEEELHPKSAASWKTNAPDVQVWEAKLEPLVQQVA